MNVYMFRLFTALVLLFLAPVSYSLEVPEGASHVTLDSHLLYLEDPSATLSIEDVMTLYRDDKMTQNTNGILNFGFSESVFWVRAAFKFESSSSLEGRWVVSLDYAPLDVVDMYIFDGQGEQVRHIASGTSKPFDARPVLHRTLLYPIENKGASEYELWLRVQSHTSIQIPLNLRTAQAYFEHETLSTYGWGIFFGIILALALYNFFLFASVKDAAYLYYVLYLLGLSGVVLFLNGQGGQYLWSRYEAWNKYALLMFTCFAVFWALQFSRAFLDTRKALRRFDNAMIGLMVLTVAAALGGGLGFDVSLPRLSGTIAALFASVLIVIGVKALKTGNPVAPYYLFAWSFFLCGIIVYLTSVFGMTPTNMLTEMSIQLGSAAEAILLSLGLAKRIKIERKLKYEALESRHTTMLKWQQAEKKLLERASYDALTSLPNSTLLYKSIEELKAEGEIKSFGLVVIHFNRFHEINKTLGKRNGDLLLIRAADRLAYQAGRIDHVLPIDRTDDYFHFLSALDGISFAALVEMNTDTEAPHSVAMQLLEVMEKPIEHEGLSIDIEAIAGVALYPVHGEELDSLAQHAAIALENSNKLSQKISTYSPELNSYSTRRLSLMGDLLKAIKADSLSLFLQPKLDLNSSKVIGAEALLRWQHEQHGFVPPDEFIPLAEQSGLIRPLTAWVIDKVLQYDKQFQTQGYDLQLSINVSAKNIAEGDFVQNTLNKFIEYNAPPKNIVFEMTESSMMENPNKALCVLSNLNELGIKLSIDDFGTGYSSLSYLTKLPVDELKIDRSFVTDMVKNSQNQKIVEMTVNLAHTLGLTVVAEGIEDRETLIQLQVLGCDVAQGYHIGRPMPVETFSQWLAKHSSQHIRSLSQCSK